MTHVQEAVLDGIGAEGPPASTVVDRLLRTDALAQWVAVNEVAPTSPRILTPMLCRICRVLYSRNYTHADSLQCPRQGSACCRMAPRRSS